jgi:pimeloyl-ACP methyl ester carboxylesterase
MSRFVYIILAIAALIYAALCLALFLAQRSFIYYPQPKAARDDTLTLSLNVDGAKIVANTRPREGPVAVIYFGGNAETVSQSLATLADAFPGHSLYALNYRGYGGSTGKPTETALISDALALFDRVHANHPRIIVIGRSLGSGVAVQIASQRPVERMVLVTPYDSLVAIAADQFRYFPIAWLMLDKFESWRYAPKVVAPTQLIAAEDDEVIPLSSTEALLKQFRPALANLVIIPGVGHNSISESSQYVPLLRGTP